MYNLCDEMSPNDIEFLKRKGENIVTDFKDCDARVLMCLSLILFLFYTFISLCYTEMQIESELLLVRKK